MISLYPKYRSSISCLNTIIRYHNLKKICKAYKLPRSGAKSTLLMYAYNYLYHSYHSTKLQKYVRGYLQRKLNRMRGPGFLSREKCVNECDFFTLEPVTKIAPSQFYSFKDSDDFIYGFDIISLWQMYERSSVVENPYNRKELPENTKQVLTKLVKLSKKGDDKIETNLQENEVDFIKEQELKIVSLFQFINTLGHYTDHSWFLGLSKTSLIRFYRELYDIWNHRAQITEEIKHRVYPQGNPFRSGMHVRLSIDSSLYDLRKICVTTCENLVFYGMTDDDKTLGAYYILTSLTLQSHDAAVALPWLYQAAI